MSACSRSILQMRLAKDTKKPFEHWEDDDTDDDLQKTLGRYLLDYFFF